MKDLSKYKPKDFEETREDLILPMKQPETQPIRTHNCGFYKAWFWLSLIGLVFLATLIIVALWLLYPYLDIYLGSSSTFYGYFEDWVGRLKQ